MFEDFDRQFGEGLEIIVAGIAARYGVRQAR
ncbi:hypothetical protein FBY34_3060 [Streptomyces sp. SLBN-115]|nr:hypothetical protein FBY34_3060 [Streptomyces sp. SLBN-115]